MENDELNQRKQSEGSSLDRMSGLFVRRANSINATPRSGFKEALLARLREARQAPQPMVSFSFADLLGSPRRAFATAGVTALVVIVAVALVFQPFFGVQPAYAFDNFTLKAEVTDTTGVDPSSTYLLESKTDVSVGNIEKVLTTNVDTAFTLKQISAKKIRVAFAEPISGEKVVQFRLETTTTDANGQSQDRPYGWAFPVRTSLRVTGTLPGNRSTGVALDTGIEVTLNYDNVSREDFEKAFTITPSVEGHVEQFRRTYVFVPEKLEPQMHYFVTLAGSLGIRGSDQTIGEDYVFEFETSPTDYRGFEFGVDEKYVAATPGSTVRIPYHRWGGEIVGYDENGMAIEQSVDDPVHAKAYRLESFDAFVATMQKGLELDWQQYVTADDLVDLSKLAVAHEFDAEAAEINYRETLVFPVALDAGYYVVDLSVAGHRDWALVEVSNLTAYVARGTERTLFWVNSAETKGPVELASVGYVGDDSGGTTDATGLGFVASDESQSNIVRITSGDDGLALALTSGFTIRHGKGGGVARSYWTVRDPGGLSSSEYWSYVYTDRPMYKPDDELHFWGFVEHRLTKARPDSVRVWIGDRGSCRYENCDEVEPIVFDQATVEGTASGTYAGTLQLTDVTPGYHDVTVEVDGVVVSRRGITVQEYVKPAYTMTFTPDVKAAFAGDMIGYTVHGEFFEGTPVKGLDVDVETGIGVQHVTLDETGNAHMSFLSQFDSAVQPEWRWHQYPAGQGMRAYPARPEEGGIEAGASVMLFGSRVYLDVDEAHAEIKNGIGSITVTARNVDPTKVTEDVSWEAKEFAPTTRAGQVIQGKLIEVTYVATETGTSYDFIRKTNVKNYSYERVEKEIASFNLTTGSDGTATYEFPAANPRANYHVRFLARDENGRADTVSSWVNQYAEDYSSDTSLQFHNDDAGDLHPWQFKGYDVNDSVHLSVYQGGKLFVMPEDARMLYFQAQNGIQETNVTASATYSFPYERRDVPNIAVYGVLFAGDVYAPVGNIAWWFGSEGFAVHYNTDLSKLSVTITPDKADYRPGEDAGLKVHVADASGKPVMAELNLNVVDEAFYALAPEYVDTVAGLYQWVDDGIEATKVSEKAELTSGAEGGGGGGERGRSLFKDTATFLAVATDADGNWTGNLPLPDNITSWRVTAQAIGADQKLAGNAQINVDATQPFFVSPVMRDSYLDDDEPMILIRANGTELGSGDAVTIKVMVKDADVEQTFTAKGKETVRFALPDLALGSHDITIDGSSGDLHDRITRTVRIVPSRLVKPTIARTTLNSSTVIAGNPDGLTFVTFADGTRGRFYDELEALAGQFGDRADEAVVRTLATEMLNKEFGESRTVPSLAPSLYQQQALQLLPYGSTDLDLTAKVALLQDTPFDEQQFKAVFTDLLYQKGNDLDAREAAQAYAVLSALGEETVLGEVQRFAARDDLGVDEQLWLALALHFSGDDEGARILYRDLLKASTTKNGYTYLEADQIETQAERTALLAAIAGALNEPARDAIHDYVVNQNWGDTLVLIEDMLFLRETFPHLKPGSSEVAYTAEGERRSAKLENGATVTLALTPDELAALTPAVVNGTVIAISRYDSRLVDPSAPVDASLAISRIYQTDGVTSNALHEGNLITVQLHYVLPASNCVDENATAPCEVYEITDALPSGLTPTTNSSAYFYGNQSSRDNGCVDYPAEIRDQRITFFVTPRTDPACANETLTYYVRVVTPGTYAAEPAYIRSTRDPNMNNHSDASVVTITE